MAERVGELSFDALFSPNTEHPYFEGAGDHPFRPRLRRPDATNAWWLAEASLLSYVPDTDFVREALIGAGFDRVRFFSEVSTAGFAAGNDREELLVFRGTEPGDWEDVKTDLDARPTGTEPGGLVHAGFRKALDLIWPEIAEHLEGIPSDRPRWFAGHSLGGALATLAAARHPGKAGLCTFGSPRVGDRKFRRAFRVPATRVVNGADIVARVPPPGLYRHVGRLTWIDRDGKLHLRSSRWKRFWDGFHSHGNRASDALRRWLDGDLSALGWQGLVDHSPVHYARRLREAL